MTAWKKLKTALSGLRRRLREGAPFSSLEAYRRCMAWLDAHCGLLAEGCALESEVRACLVQMLELWGETERAARVGALPVAPGPKTSGESPKALMFARGAAGHFSAGGAEAGEADFRRLLRMQDRAGGFGAGELSAGFETAGAFLKCLHERLLCNFERTAPIFPSEISPEDGRFQLIEELLRAFGKTPCVADIGCGKGRMIRLLKQRHPGICATAVDISDAMLSLIPQDIRARRGSLLHNGLPPASMDFVFCVEALEHAVNARGAVRELARITAAGGTLLIIDKCVSWLGSMEICDWEQWFDEQEVSRWLVQEGFEVEVRRGIRKPGQEAPDMRFLCWIARKLLVMPDMLTDDTSRSVTA